MSGIRPHLSPLALCRVSVGPLYHVEDFLTVGRHVLHGYATLLPTETILVGTRVLARHASRKHRQRLCSNVLAELEILIESQSSCLVIVPYILVGHPVLPRSHGMVPMVDIVNALAMTHTASREPYELRFQRGYCLGKVFAQSMSLVSVMREQRYHVQGYLGIFLSHNDQAAVLHLSAIELCAFLGISGQSQGISLPFPASHLQLALGHHRAVVGNQCHGHLLCSVGHHTGIHGEVVGRTLVGYAIPSYII